MDNKENIKVVISGESEGLSSKVDGRLYDDVIASVEKSLIERALERSEGNKSRAARILGINRNTLHTKIKKLSVDVARFKL